MKQQALTAQEMVDKFRKKIPHLNLRLGTAEDLEASTMYIHFSPRLIRSKKPADAPKVKKQP